MINKIFERIATAVITLLLLIISLITIRNKNEKISNLNNEISKKENEKKIIKSVAETDKKIEQIRRKKYEKDTSHSEW